MNTPISFNHLKLETMCIYRTWLATTPNDGNILEQWLRLSNFTNMLFIWMDQVVWLFETDNTIRKFVPFYERPNIDQAINTIPLPAPVTCESKLPDDPPSPVANLGKPPVIPVTQGSLEPPAKTKIIRRIKFQSEKGLIVRKYLFYKGGNARITGRFVLICSLIIWSFLPRYLVLGTG